MECNSCKGAVDDICEAYSRCSSCSIHGHHSKVCTMDLKIIEKEQEASQRYNREVCQ